MIYQVYNSAAATASVSDLAFIMHADLPLFVLLVHLLNLPWLGESCSCKEGAFSVGRDVAIRDSFCYRLVYSWCQSVALLMKSK